MLNPTRTLTAVVAFGAAATLTFSAPAATAAPATGSSSGSSSSGCGPRSAADHLFLRDSYFDEEPCDVQDAAIQLAHADCHWLDVHGGSVENQIALAESNRDAVDYPYTFVDAAIIAYCPHHEL
ncbi:DUF732 domain-containing protein [Nocardia cyriacigeorgica]|uniref:DUF732 domain-containing protein n=1 Tax=Nocardia cyriacigeorgica TaxID=135487 RepID=UPI0018956F21|nr:DUF732 domain-containing protein [Nocardia cyriacigeorgica]MBF6455527.1 DUF732 domain-containing protein [Nocardia cyriacigeorgica]MBF6482125.1 DUF732 domain-containing protein [Nocardia cyriacigeorgica]MBF6553731.1 DUF732 domain-containing protein [Nocardia cyriacigeorgica]